MSSADVDGIAAEASMADGEVPPDNVTLLLNDNVEDDDELNNTETLAMSESDDDEQTEDRIKSALSSEKISFSKLIDSDEESDCVTGGKEQSDSESPAKKSRRKKTILSDSDEDNDDEATDSKSLLKKYEDIDDESRDSETPAPISRRKKTVLSDSDDEDNGNVAAKKKTRKKKSSKSGSDDESKKSRKKIKKKNETAAASDDDSNNKLYESDQETPKPNIKPFDNLFDPESSEDEQQNGNSEGSPAEDKPSSKRSKPARPPKRAAAQAAEDDMKTIQSESQRLLREQMISVPYHRPKQHSLQTFLSRRTVIAPNQVRPDAKKAAASLKMTGDELEAYARQLEERERESQQFYKSDSSDDNEDDAPEPTQESIASKADPVEDPIVRISTDEQETVEHIPVEDADQPNDILPSQPIELVVDNPPTVPVVTHLELLKQRLDSAQLRASPKLTGGANMIIDLDSGVVVPDSRKSGPTELYERFLRHSTKTPVAATRDGGTLSVQSTGADGQINYELLVLPPTHNEEVIQDSKPRSAFYKLKAELAETLAQKRREQIEGRRKEEAELKGDRLDEEDEEEDCESELDEEEELAKADAIEADESDEADAEHVDEDAEEEEDDQNEDEGDNDSDDEENDEPKSRKRIVLPMDSDVENDNDEQIRPFSDVDAMLNICATNPDALYDSVPPAVPEIAGDGEFMTQNEAVSESQLADLCSGVFMTQKPTECLEEESSQHDADAERTETITSARPTLDTSSDEDEENGQPKVKKVKKLRKKRIAKLSDDEDDDDEPKPSAKSLLDEVDNSDASDDEAERQSDDAGAVDEDEEEPTAVVEYDSEENEVQIVRQTKAEHRKRAGAFIENEAELSESDWGSADEDEHQLNQMDIEKGDADEFDNDELREELARIHMRRLMDADAREVQTITEDLLPEEEELGAQRERQFKWKSLNDTNWAQDELDRNNGDGPDVAGTQSDDENEEAWRKMRHEREQLLKDMDRTTVAVDLQASVAPSPNASMLDGTRKRRINVIKSSSNTPQMNDRSQATFLIGNEKKSIRNSFLTRDDETLARLANMVKSDAAEVSGGIGQVATGVSKGHGNFVFSTLSPAPDKAAGKRKSCADHGDAEEPQQQPKKPKNAEMVFKKRLLDSLT